MNPTRLTALAIMSPWREAQVEAAGNFS